MKSLRNCGLTLIELLIATGIAVTAGVFLLVIIVNSSGLFYRQNSKVQTGLNINDALGSIRGSIKQASAVAVSYTSGPTTYLSGANQLVLKVVSIDASGNPVPNTYDFFVIYQSQNMLNFKIFPDAQSSRQPIDRIFSTSVDNLNFQYFNSANPPVEVPPQNATRVRVVLTLKQKAGASFEINTATSEANLRND